MRKTAEEIRKLDDRKTFTVEVPLWGLTGPDSAIVRELTPLQMIRLGDSCTDETGNRDESKFMGRVIVEACVEPKFGPNDAEWLVSEKSNVAVRKLYLTILRGYRPLEQSGTPSTPTDSSTTLESVL